MDCRACGARSDLRGEGACTLARTIPILYTGGSRYRQAGDVGWQWECFVRNGREWTGRGKGGESERGMGRERRGRRGGGRENKSII